MAQRYKEMHILSVVQNQKMVLSSVAIGPAKIITQGVQQGVYSWLVEAPYLVEMSDARQKHVRKIVLRGLVVHADEKVHYRGLALDKMAVKYTPAELQGSQPSQTSLKQRPLNPAV